MQTMGHALIFKASALWADAIYRSICPYVCLSVCLSVCLCVCAFTFELPFKRLFAPTSQSRMSNIFRDFESLGKSNGKKYSELKNTNKGCKIAAQKRFFWANLGLFNH